MNPTKLNPLLKKHSGAAIALPEPIAAREPIATLIFSFLLWESSTAQAVEAYQRLQQIVVDANDLRVSLPTEIIAALGPRYAKAEERALRLRATLNDLFRREHAVSFPQEKSGKRDIKAYVESLEGMVVSYVAARVLLLNFGVHAIPVDEQTRAVLAAAGACEAGTEIGELGASLSRHVKAETAEAAHHAIQSHVDAAHQSLMAASRHAPGASSGSAPRAKSGAAARSAAGAKKAKGRS